MSRFWTIAVFLDFIFCLVMATVALGFGLSPWVFALIFATGDLVITLVAVLVSGAEDWPKFLRYFFVNYLVLMTILVALGDVGMVFDLMAGEVLDVFTLVRLGVCNAILLVTWLLNMDAKKKPKAPSE